MERDKRAVVAGLSGGLGNQMFQYAAARALSLRLGCPLHLDTSWYLGRRDRFYALAPFAVTAPAIVGMGPFPDTVKRLESKIARRLARNRMGVPIFRERQPGFTPSFAGLTGPVYLEGYWQSERYFAENRHVITGDFDLREGLPEKCRPFLDQIASSEAVCVHVRRGDYLTDPINSKVYESCGLDYYQNGLSVLEESVRKPHCFVFSDDPGWVRANFGCRFPVTVVDINAGAEAHWDLHLMAACKHFIIANSSLSWWAAWLCRYPDKRVIAPSRWFRDRGIDTGDLIPGTWRRI